MPFMLIDLSERGLQFSGVQQEIGIPDFRQNPETLIQNTAEKALA